MKVLIVDDEIHQLDYLETQLNRLDSADIDEVEKVKNPVEALKLLKSTNYDLIFLDVEMPEMTGFELIEIFGVNNLPPLIFTTAFSQYAIDAFRVNAVDYLLKPIDPDDLSRAIEKVKELMPNHNSGLKTLVESPPHSLTNRIVITEGQSYLFIRHSEILYIKGSGSYATFYLASGKKVTTSKRLNVYWKRLLNHGFLRPHQSYVVNPVHISEYSKRDGGFLILTGGHEIPVSTGMKKEIKGLLGIG